MLIKWLLKKKILKLQLKQIENKLDRNIEEVKEIELKNSLLREQAILQTN